MSSKNKWSLESSCRLCADMCNRDLDHILLEENKSAVDLIDKYLSIKVGPSLNSFTITVNDTLPIQVCEACRMKVILFNEYALKCSATQITLSSMSQEYKEVDKTDSFFETVKTECNTDSIYDDHMIDDSSIKSENEDSSVFQDKHKHKSKRKIKHKLFLKKNSARRKKKLIQAVTTDVNINLSEVKFELNGNDNSVKPKELKPSSLSNCAFINFICHICNEEFLQWNSLQKHTTQIHKDIPKILCICDKYLRSQKSVYTHIKIHDSDSFQHKCTQCSSSFYAEKSLTKHYLSEHANTNPPEYKCEYCGDNFHKLYMLNQHKRKHLPSEVRNIRPCGICGKKFKTNSNLQIHINAVHKKEKSCVCDICGKSLSTKGGLKSHRALHSGERPYLCPHCPKTYKSNFTLMRHKNIHNDVIYKCSKCPSSFSYETNLREHMHIHSDICRFVCGFCNKGFKWKQPFEAHLNIHTGRTPYSCPWCPKTFADGSNCRIHKRRAHPVELAEYEAKHGINSEKIKRIVSSETTVIRSIQFNDVVKSQTFPKIDYLNPAKSGIDEPE